MSVIQYEPACAHTHTPRRRIRIWKLIIVAIGRKKKDQATGKGKKNVSQYLSMRVHITVSLGLLASAHIDYAGIVILVPGHMAHAQA